MIRKQTDVNHTVSPIPTLPDDSVTIVSWSSQWSLQRFFTSPSSSPFEVFLWAFTTRLGLASFSFWQLGKQIRKNASKLEVPAFVFDVAELQHLLHFFPSGLAENKGLLMIFA